MSEFNYNIQQKKPQIVVHEHDVLSGRGVNIAHHSGNQRFRSLVTTRADESYCTSYSSSEKKAVAEEIISHIESLDPPGRFLKRDGRGQVSRGLAGPWEQLSRREAIRKACQALRDCNRLDRQGYAAGVEMPSDVVHVSKSIQSAGLTGKQQAARAAAEVAAAQAAAAMSLGIRDSGCLSPSAENATEWLKRQQKETSIKGNSPTLGSDTTFSSCDVQPNESNCVDEPAFSYTQQLGNLSAKCSPRQVMNEVPSNLSKPLGTNLIAGESCSQNVLNSQFPSISSSAPFLSHSKPQTDLSSCSSPYYETHQHYPSFSAQVATPHARLTEPRRDSFSYLPGPLQCDGSEHTNNSLPTFPHSNNGFQSENALYPIFDPLDANDGFQAQSHHHLPSTRYHQLNLYNRDFPTVNEHLYLAQNQPHESTQQTYQIVPTADYRYAQHNTDQTLSHLPGREYQTVPEYQTSPMTHYQASPSPIPQRDTLNHISIPGHFMGFPSNQVTTQSPTGFHPVSESDARPGPPPITPPDLEAYSIAGKGNQSLPDTTLTPPSKQAYHSAMLDAICDDPTSAVSAGANILINSAIERNIPSDSEKQVFGNHEEHWEGEPLQL
jgi:hypothetical protein